jgi:hypothetical protein
MRNPFERREPPSFPELMSARHTYFWALTMHGDDEPCMIQQRARLSELEARVNAELQLKSPYGLQLYRL